MMRPGQFAVLWPRVPNKPSRNGMDQQTSAGACILLRRKLSAEIIQCRATTTHAYLTRGVIILYIYSYQRCLRPHWVLIVE